MQTPQANMINDLATSENYFVVKDLVRLWPEISFEHHKKLFVAAFNVVGIWDDYEIYGKYSDQCLQIIKKPFLGNDFFCFVIATIEGDKNWYFGVKGPWELHRNIPEAIDLKNNCDQLKLSTWNNWRFEYFQLQRSQVLDLLTRGADVSQIMQTMVRQFAAKCLPLKNQVENINTIISK